MTPKQLPTLVLAAVMAASTLTAIAQVAIDAVSADIAVAAATPAADVQPFATAGSPR